MPPCRHITTITPFLARIMKRRCLHSRTMLMSKRFLSDGMSVSLFRCFFVFDLFVNGSFLCRVLYDSWWYRKQEDVPGQPQDPSHGAINWTDADPKIFPSGLKYMYEKTGWPVVAHNRVCATPRSHPALMLLHAVVLCIFTRIWKMISSLVRTRLP